MKPIIIESPWLCEKLSWFLRIHSITLFPFVLTIDKSDEKVMNHEAIHIYQQMETLIVGFWIIYVFHYLINLIKYRDSIVAYREIIFEKEAYAFERDLNYLNKRKWFSWIKKLPNNTFY